MSIDTRQEDLTVWEPPSGIYGSVMLFFLHLPTAERLKLWQRVRTTLKPGGVFVLEGYSVEHAAMGNIGPTDPDVMFPRAELEEYFAGYEIVRSQLVQRVLTNNEGHSANASILQFVARKPDKVTRVQ